MDSPKRKIAKGLVASISIFLVTTLASAIGATIIGVLAGIAICGLFLYDHLKGQ